MMNLDYLPIEPVELSDSQWEKIVRHSNLPDDARLLVGRVVAFYRVSDKALHSSQTPVQTRALLGKLAKLTNDLRNGLADLSNDRRAIVCLTLAIDPPQDFGNAMGDRVANRDLADAIKNLTALAKWLSDAQSRVTKSKPGARAKAILTQLVVFTLDKILLRYCGEGISRSIKRTNKSREYIKAVISIADPSVPVRAIEEAMKRQIKSRGRIPRGAAS